MLNEALFDIFVTFLSTNGKITAQQLADKYELSKRTIIRYIDVLLAANVPIVTYRGNKGGYCLSENYKISSLYFDKAEYQLIASALNNLAPPYNTKQIETILNKLTALNKSLHTDYLLRSDQLFVTSSSNGSINNKVTCLSNNIKNQQLISIVYHDTASSITTRQVEPHSLTYNDGMWYLYAYCHLRDSFRIFKVSRIATITTMEETFERRPIDLKDRQIGNHQSDLATIDLMLQIQPTARTQVEEWLGIENVTTTPSGSVAANVTIANDNNLLSKLLSLGADVTVVYPTTLKAQLLQTAKDLIAKYNV